MQGLRMTALVAGARQSGQTELTLRYVDGEMQRGVLGMIRALKHRPSEPFDDVARGKSRPWRFLLRRCIEAAMAGATREEAETLVASLQRALDLVWGLFGRSPSPLQLRLLPSPTVLPLLARQPNEAEQAA